MINNAPTSTLERLNPILSIEKDCILSKQGDYTVAFELQLPEIFTLTEQEYWNLHDTWVKAIRALPEYSVLHKQDVFVQRKYQPAYNGPEPSFLSKSFQLHFAERPYLEHKCYLYLTKTCKANSRKQSLFTTLCRGRLVPLEIHNQTTLDRFMEAVNQFTAILEASSFIKMRRLTEADLVGAKEKTGLLDSYFNFFESTPAVADYELRSDRIIHGNQQACVYAISDVDDLPMQVSPARRHDALSTDRSDCHLSYSAPICQLLAHNHIYNQYIFIDDVKEMTRKLSQRSKQMHSLSKLSRENTINAQYIEDFLDLVLDENMLPCRAHMNVIAWGTEENYDQMRNDVAAALSLMDLRPRQVTADAPVFFWSGVPGNGADFPSEDTFIQFAESVTCFFNSETSYASSDSPFGIKLVDRFTYVPLHVDISDEPMKRGITTNRNKFVLGPSGSGKSFFTNHLVRQYWEQGAHIIMVDTGNSYLGTCQWVQQKTGGQDGIYYTYTEDIPITFNPFYTDDRKFDVEKRESIATLLLTLWKKEDEYITRSEETKVSEAVYDYTRLIETDPDVVPSFNHFYEYLETEFADKLKRMNVREKEFDLTNFLLVLRPYYKGEQYDYLLNATDNLDLLSKRFVVFELDNIKDHKILFPVVTIIIMESFINKMRKLTGIRKVILIEEAWKAIAKSGMADFIKYLFKTVRKHFGEAVVVTQEVDDIISSPIVKESIINNSDCKILLDQNRYMNKFEDIQSLLGLTDKQKAQVLSINQNLNPGFRYKEVYIDLGGRHSCVYATEVSWEEYLAYTTEQTEKQEVFDRAAKYGGNIEDAIRDMAMEKQEKQ
ncbi:MAG: TraG family conjugative transposon ATPase [Bacteroides sp.]|nr:TraG family conjugative transposon ATPase [Bacteroides sp.]MCM1531459.1 TraG family conjugative transposon ATPase [Ruminococcus flavefaciens]MCM1554379.1 TraG family conjugative transposon ATPase [Bacteroides sp.]